MTTTTVKVTTTSVQAIELPKYFKSTRFQDMYFMILDDRNYIRLFNRDYDKPYSDGSEFQTSLLANIGSWIEPGIEAVTHEEFERALSEAVAHINKMVSDHAKN
jgi:hypothetical protein